MNSKPSLGRLLGAALCLGLSAAAFAAPRKPPAKPANVAPMPVTTPKPKAPSATPAPGDVVVYNGADAATAGLTLAAWGGGSVQDSTDISFAKGHSLKVVTLGPYQGARITFNTPLDLGSLDDKSRMFQITLRLTKADRTFSPASPTDDNNGFPDQGGPDQGMPGDDGGVGGQFGGAGQASPPLSTLQTVHFVFTLANGAQADILRPMPAADTSGAEQWVNLAVPLAALKFSPAADGSPLQSVSIAGDDYAVFYIGQIKLIQDTAPITCYAGDNQDVMPRQPVMLHGSADGGASSLQYAWDFDDKDGVTAQAYGPDVTTQYLTSGDYKVTLTVSDIDGLKKPATSITTIHVRQ